MQRALDLANMGSGFVAPNPLVGCVIVKNETIIGEGFHQKYGEQPDAAITRQPDYQSALLHNLLLQTSCFRYWGQGAWTEHAREIYRRGQAITQG